MGVLVRQLGKNQDWYCCINHRGERGYKKFPTKKEAEAFAKTARQKIADGETFRSARANLEEPTFEVYARKWVEKHVQERGLTVRTHESYSGEIEKHLIPFFGKRPLTEISRAEVEEYVGMKMRSGLSWRTADYHRTIMSGIFNAARRTGILKENPAERFGRCPKPRLSEKASVLDEAEEKKLLELVYQKHPDYFACLFTLLRTGIRRGELLGLKMVDVDTERAILKVCRSIDEQGRISLPKRGKARVVAISMQLAAVLSWHSRRLEASGKPESEWLFPNPVKRKAPKGVRVLLVDPGPIRGDHLLRKFREFLKEAEVGRRRLHDLRHTAITRALEKGADMAMVQKLAGHSSIQMTVNVYGHIQAGALGAVVAVLDDPSLKCLRAMDANQARVAAGETIDVTDESSASA